MHPALFYLPGGRLSRAELAAARLDGDVIEVGEGYMPTDTVEGPDARATSLGSIVPTGCAACGPTAAWIHGAGSDPPFRHHLQRAVPRRLRIPPPSVHLVIHESPVDERGLEEIGGIPVTALGRTASDLARRAPQDAVMRQWLTLLAQALPHALTEGIDDLQSRPRVPGKTGALGLLARIRQDAVTR